jgi:hypothetical protein
MKQNEIDGVADQIKQIYTLTSIAAEETNDSFVLAKLHNILEDCHTLAKYLLVERQAGVNRIPSKV